MVYFQKYLLGGLRVNHYVNNENKYFCIFLVAIYMTLNVKPLRKCMQFWVHIISYHKLTSLYINYTTNVFLPVVHASIVYFSILHLYFVSLFWLSFLSMFQAQILALRVHFIPVSCLFFDPTSLICECIVAKSK